MRTVFATENRNASGFTLVELLVVIAIIAILASLLLPTLAKSKDAAKRTVCINNQHQLYLAWAMYTHDNNGRIPGNHIMGGIAPEVPAWVSGDMSYESDPVFGSRKSENTNVFLIKPGRHGSIGPYVGGVGPYRCPSDFSWVVIGGQRHSRLRSYSMNTHTGSDGFNVDVRVRYKTFYTEGQVNSVGGDNLFLFIDEHEDTIEDGNFDYFGNAAPGWRHSLGSVITFANGAARLQKWKDPRTRLPILRKRQWAPPQDTVDMKWIHAHSTVRE